MNAVKLISTALTSSGSTWVPLARVKELLVDYKLPIDEMNFAIERGDIIHFIDEEKNSWLTTSYYHKLENTIAENIIRLTYTTSKTYEESYIRKLIAEFEKVHNDGKHLHYQQVKAIIMVVNNNFSILTGGPGTGKTTVLSAINYVLRRINPKIRISFTAPTGKAARRITESTGECATTVHKKFGLVSDSSDGEAFIDDVLFIDESSMNDTALTATVATSVYNSRKLVFVGDVDQLPSVGPGAVLRDLIASKVVPVTGLTKTFRQDNTSTLYLNICNIRDGIASFIKGADFSPICVSNTFTQEEAIAKLKLLYAQEIEKYGVENVVVLLPYRKKGLCSNVLNAHLQLIANKNRYGYKYYNHADKNTIVFMKDDMVMQLENRAECANGDVGKILEINEDGCTVSYGGIHVHYALSELNQLSLAYSTTIHKSQGSEYKSVILVLLGCHKTMLNKNILYTGITRAKINCTVLYQEDALETAIRTVADENRITMLKRKLQTAYLQHQAK